MDILEKLNNKFLHGEFDNFITEINLPYFKNIKIGTQINFTFPLTVLIGQNGCGKSSCLQAKKDVQKVMHQVKIGFQHQLMK